MKMGFRMLPSPLYSSRKAMDKQGSENYVAMGVFFSWRSIRSFLFSGLSVACIEVHAIAQ